MRWLSMGIISLLFATSAQAQFAPIAANLLDKQHTLDDCRAALREVERGDVHYRERACMAQLLGFWDGYLAYVDSARVITRIKDECSDQRQEFYDRLRQRQPIPDRYLTSGQPLDITLLRASVEIMQYWHDKGDAKSDWSKPAEMPVAAGVQSYLSDAGNPPANADHAQLLPYPEIATLRQRCADGHDVKSYCVNYLAGTLTGTTIAGWMISSAPVVACSENAFVAEINALGKKDPFYVLLQQEWKTFIAAQQKPLKRYDLQKMAEFFVWFMDRHPQWLEERGSDGKLLKLHQLIVKIQEDKKDNK